MKYKILLELEKYFSVSVYFIQNEDNWKVFINVPDKQTNEMYKAPDFTYDSMIGYSVIEEFKKILDNSNDVLKDVLRISNSDNQTVFRYIYTLEENPRYQHFNDEFKKWIESEEGKLYQKVKRIIDVVEKNLSSQIDHGLINFTEKYDELDKCFNFDIPFYETAEQSIAIWDSEIFKEVEEFIFDDFKSFREFVIILNEFAKERQIEFYADIIKEVLHFSLKF